MCNQKRKHNEDSGEFSFVPKEARGCMTDEELEEALGSMNLSATEESAVREVCRRGFVITPEHTEDGDSDDYDVDKCLASGNYSEITANAFYSVTHINYLLYSAICRTHRLDRLVSLKCPDIITTNETRMAREKIGAIQNVLDEVDEDLRKLQLKTDRRSDEGRLLDAVFGSDKRRR